MLRVNVFTIEAHLGILTDQSKHHRANTTIVRLSALIHVDLTGGTKVADAACVRDDAAAIAAKCDPQDVSAPLT
jgi:hypothetical protein